MSEVSIRNFQKEEEPVLLGILERAFGIFHDTPETNRVLHSPRFDPAGCFLAIVHNSPVGCIAVTNLHRENWFVIRYLAAQNASAAKNVIDRLLNRAAEHFRLKNAEYVRATTPAIQPYVDVYKQHNFKPARRDFRIIWDLTSIEHRETELEIVEVSDDTLDLAASCYVEGSAPYWEWRTREHGGTKAVLRSFKEEFRHSGKWIGTLHNGRMIGLAGLIPDYHGPGSARFRGAFVRPESRGRGIGESLMTEAVSLGQKLGQRRMTVYTFSYLDSLAPGAHLYLKSGGKVEAEYLQLQLG